MMMLAWAAIALFSHASSRTILPRQTNFTTIRFGIIAIHSGSPIHLSSVNAADTKFWIGRDTETYCPLANATLCPPGTDTAFVTATGSDFLGLDTEVPGGQSVYVTAGGALSYTIAHSAFIPPGSSYESFDAMVPSDDSTLGTITYNGTDFLACPTNGTSGPFQVFADIDGLDDKDMPAGCVKECISFLAATIKRIADLPAAWQYE